MLPVARRWPNATDGVALVIGSMAPDFAYALNGSRFSLWAHSFPALALFCVPATLLASCVVVRLLAPVVADHLPDGGSFHFRDYRGLATHRFGLIRSSGWALIGAMSHVALDHFTHEWGWFARNVSWYRTVVIPGDWLGRSWTVFRIVQYLGHIGGTVCCVWLLWRYGRARWMAGRAAQVARFPATTATAALLWGATAVGVVVALAWVVVDRRGSATDVIRISGGAFAGLSAGALLLRARVSDRTETST